MGENPTEGTGFSHQNGRTEGAVGGVEDGMVPSGGRTREVNHHLVTRAGNNREGVFSGDQAA